MYTDRQAVDLGLELPSWISNTVRDAFQAARDTVLQRGGRAIAETPQGQAGIRQELQRRGLQVVRTAAPVGVPVILGLGALTLFLLSRRR